MYRNPLRNIVEYLLLNLELVRNYERRRLMLRIGELIEVECKRDKEEIESVQRN